MENLIEGRIILGFLCLIHVFAGYAVSIPWGPIRKRTLNGIFGVELIAVTAYIIYDNLQTPPYDGWFLAIIGYLSVYALILITWVSYRIYALLDIEKTYEMTIESHVRFMNDDYFKGIVVESNREVEVMLPYSPELVHQFRTREKVKVKFASVIKGTYVIVKLA